MLNAVSRLLTATPADLLAGGTDRLEPAGTWADRLARAVANVLSPPVATVGILVLVGSQTGNGVSIWRWAALFSVVGLLPPLAYVAWLVRRGKVTDIHLPKREERTRPYVATLGSSGAALMGLNGLGAPSLLVLAGASGWVLTALLFAITLRWKISTHCAAAAALAALAIGVRGAPALPLFAIVPMVAWSRVRLGRHDRAQVLAGAFVGAVVTATVWVLFT
jgi:membrane-associated phospholipid phosphatase